MKQLDYDWNLRIKMAEHGMFSTTDLHPHLADRGITLSREQVYRLVTGHPQRLSMDILCALCDILECTPNDLIAPKVIEAPRTAASGHSGTTAPVAAANVTPLRNRRTKITRPGGNA